MWHDFIAQAACAGGLLEFPGEAVLLSRLPIRRFVMQDKAALFTSIYTKLYQLVPTLDELTKITILSTPGFRELHIDPLTENADYRLVSLSHYASHPSGYSIPAPNIVIKIHKHTQTAEALYYQDVDREDQVYGDEGELIDAKIQRRVNKFLETWLNTLLQNEYRISTSY